MLKNNKIYIFFTAVFLLFLCLITYGDILTHGFMIDERTYLKPTATIFASYQNLGDFFKKPMDHHYNPFNHLLNVALFLLFQNPFPLYLINLILFYINCFLLFILVYFLSESFITALFTSVIFCIHPMTADILQHITLNILLVQTIFMELSLIALYLYSKQNKNIFYYIFSFLMAILALFCHEIILLFPLYVWALLFCLTDLKFRRIIKLTIPFVFLNIFLIALWLHFVNVSVHLENVKTWHPRFMGTLSANFSHLFFWYLSNLVVPRNIVFICNRPPLVDFIWFWNLLFFGFLTGCGFLIFFYFKKSLESFALVLFLTGFVFAFFASQVLFESKGEWLFEPNWVYFPSIGFYLFIVLIFLRLRKYLNKKLFIVFTSVLFIFYFLLTLNLNILSRTELSYCENWLRKSPDNYTAGFIAASYYCHHKGIVIPSDIIPDMLYLTDIAVKDDFREAPDLIERILSSNISSTQRKELSYQLAAYHCKNGHKDKCDEAIYSIVGSQKDSYAYVQLGYAFYKCGANKAAINLLKQCIALYPTYKEPYILIGVILANSGHYEESLNSLKQALAIDPRDVRIISKIEEAKNLINKSY